MVSDTFIVRLWSKLVFFFCPGLSYVVQQDAPIRDKLLMVLELHLALLNAPFDPRCDK